MMYVDDSRRGRPFAKDPAVVRFDGSYWLYYSIPPFGDGRKNDGSANGIPRSTDLEAWYKVGEILPQVAYEQNGLGAPGAIVLEGQIHLFYQTYGNWEKDAICHAVSEDGLHFSRNATNPIFAPTGAWTVGRAIDADVIVHEGQLFLYFATRDPEMRIQMLGVAAAPLDSGFGHSAWTQLCDAPILKPELPWEQECIEAATVCKHAGTFFMFYGGAYNNKPQQIGCATSEDGIHWRRLSDKPFLPNGEPGTWNSSESGHPFVFVDDDGSTYLFFQGNNDNGRTWYLSKRRIGWKGNGPYLVVES